MRQREDHMHVWRRQEFAGAHVNPAVSRVALTPGTMTIPARIKRDGGVSALRARVQMSAERRRTAALDGSQHFQVQPVQPGTVAVNETPACGADEISHLERWPCHHLSFDLLLSFLSFKLSRSRGLAVAFR